MIRVLVLFGTINVDGRSAVSILDEPTNALDPSGIRWFREFIKAQAKHGKTVLLSSHILSEVEAVPAVEHIGFETLLFGLLPMAVWGAVFGALEFKTHSMRTSLLSIHSKSLLFATKFVVMLLVAWLISMGSIVASISATHLSLGSAGLTPIILSPLVWKWMLLASVSWTSVTILAFVIGFLFRTAVTPLLFLIPQIYNGGNLLAEYFWPAKYLPVAMGNTLIATSERIDQVHLEQSISVLVLWILVLGIAAYWRFHTSDVGGRY